MNVSDKIKRDSKGCFKHTGETNCPYFFGKYGQRNIWEKEHGPIPDGHVIHHIDGNKYNNDISNLAMMTYKDHNQLHKHPAWNKGKSWDKKTLKKIHTKRNRTFMQQWHEWVALRNEGLTYKQIGEIVGRHERSVMDGIHKYRREIEEHGSRYYGLETSA